MSSSLPRLNTYMDFDLAIFEIDDVLIPTHKKWCLFIDDIFDRQEQFEPPEDYFRSFGGDLRRIFSTMIDEYFVPMTMDELYDMYRFNVEMPIVNLPFISEAKVYINGLCRLCKSMAICSKLPKEIITKILENDFNNKFTGWQYRYFNFIFSTENIEEGKNPYKFIADNLNKDYRQCIVFDNKKSSFEKSHSLGMRNYYIKTGTTDCTQVDFDNYKITQIDSFKDLIN